MVFSLAWLNKTSIKRKHAASYCQRKTTPQYLSNTSQQNIRSFIDLVIDHPRLLNQKFDFNFSRQKKQMCC